MKFFLILIIRFEFLSLKEVQWIIVINYLFFRSDMGSQFVVLAKSSCLLVGLIK